VRLYGIRRSPRFSPGQHADNDRLIFDATVRVLQQRGWRIQVLAEDEVGHASVHGPAVFSMCQGSVANQILDVVERRGTLIINSPKAAQNCHRARLHRILGRDHGLFAPTALVRTDGLPEIPAGLSCAGGLWIKRGDVHATQPGDVVRVETLEEYQAVLRQFRLRGIATVVVQQHLPGEVVKFYGVVGASFFRFYCERDYTITPLAFAAARPGIESLVRRVGLEIYGGDAVMTPEGRLVVIDLNDWPSFARFRGEAAEVIGNYIHGRVLGQDLHPLLRQEPEVSM
jgi:hypothetical protein